MNHKVTLTIIILFSSAVYSNIFIDNLFLIEKDAINSKSYFLNVKKPYLAGLYTLGVINVDGSYNNQRSHSFYMNSFSPSNADSTTQTWFNYNSGSFDYMHTEVGAILKDKYDFQHQFSGKGTSFRGAYSEHPNQTLVESYFYNIGKNDSLEVFDLSYMYYQENLNEYSFVGGDLCNDSPQKCSVDLERFESVSYFLAAKYSKKGRFLNFLADCQFKTGSYNFFELTSKIKQYSLNVLIERDFFDNNIFLEIDNSKYNNSLFQETSTINLSKIGLKRDFFKLNSVLNIVSLSNLDSQLYSDMEFFIKYKLSDYFYFSIEKSIDSQNLFNNVLWANTSLNLSWHSLTGYFGELACYSTFFSAKSIYHKNMLNNNFKGSTIQGSIFSYIHKYKYLNFHFRSVFYQNDHQGLNDLTLNQESIFNIKNFNHFEVEYSPIVKGWKISPFSKINYRNVSYGKNNKWEFFDYRLVDISFGFKASGFMFEYVIHNYNPSNQRLSDIWGHDELIGVNLNGNPSATFPLYQVNYFKVVWHFVD